jgi:hypothetical protein
MHACARARALSLTNTHDSGGVADQTESAKGGSDQGPTRLHEEANSAYTWYPKTEQNGLERYNLSLS